MTEASHHSPGGNHLEAEVATAGWAHTQVRDMEPTLGGHEWSCVARGGGAERSAGDSVPAWKLGSHHHGASTVPSSESRSHCKRSFYGGGPVRAPQGTAGPKVYPHSLLLGALSHGSTQAALAEHQARGRTGREGQPPGEPQGSALLILPHRPSTWSPQQVPQSSVSVCSA